MKPVIIMSTYPNKKSVRKISQIVIKKQLAACVNFMKISSVYTWKGKIENDNEFLVLFKTTSKNKNQLKREIRNDHPYEVPEIVEIEISSLNKSYLTWLIDSTS